MRRLLLVLGLLAVVGCQTAKTKGEWAEAWKDLRGENMELRYGGKSGMAEDWNEKPMNKVRE